MLFEITRRRKPLHLSIKDTLSREWEGRVVRVHHVTILNGNINYSEFSKYDILPIQGYNTPIQPVTMCRFVQPMERLKSGLVNGTTWKSTWKSNTNVSQDLQCPQRFQPSNKYLVF